MNMFNALSTFFDGKNGNFISDIFHPQQQTPTGQNDGQIQVRPMGQQQVPLAQPDQIQVRPMGHAQPANNSFGDIASLWGMARGNTPEAQAPELLPIPQPPHGGMISKIISMFGGGH